MVMAWQEELPEAQGSIPVTVKRELELFRSRPFPVKVSGSLYQVRVVAEWDDSSKNGSNRFWYREMVVVPNGKLESEYVSMSEVPPEILESIPESCRRLRQWNDWHPFGPWYYMENGLFNAGDRDCWGLRKGERKQVKTAKGELMWNLLAVSMMGDAPYGEPVPLYKLPTLLTGDKPTQTYRLEWFPCYRIGEGKQRDLEAFRRVVNWPEATMADIEREDLSEVLKARLPGLLREFRATVEGLGFTW